MNNLNFGNLLISRILPLFLDSVIEEGRRRFHGRHCKSIHLAIDYVNFVILITELFCLFLILQPNRLEIQYGVFVIMNTFPLFCISA